MAAPTTAETAAAGSEAPAMITAGFVQLLPVLAAAAAAAAAAALNSVLCWAAGKEGS